MRKLSGHLMAGILAAACAAAQTNVYLRAGGPQPQVITGATNATPIVITTQNAHGFSPSCGTTTVCYCATEGMPMGTGAAPTNKPGECAYVDSTHLAMYDLAGNPLTGTGSWWNGNSPYPGGQRGAQWLAPLTQFTIPANSGPLGFFDGTNGDLMRRLALSTFNGLTGSNGISVSGCLGGTHCVVTIQTTYDPTTFGKIPVAAGQHFSITGTGTRLDTCGDGTASPGAQSPYTIASAGSSGWVSAPFTCTGLTNGDYTNVNLHCGPAPTPNDTIGGTQTCSRVSLIATTANPVWNYMVYQMAMNNLISPATYKTTFDGGSVIPGSNMQAVYAMAAIRFLVDPTNTLWLNEILYSLNNDFRTGGVGYAVNNNAWVLISDWQYNYTTDEEGLALEYAVAVRAPEGQYWAAAEQSAFLDRIYNDVDDPSVSACTTTNQDAGNAGTHNWVLSSGVLAAGTNDATHAQLPASDPNFGTVDYYVNTVIMIQSGATPDYAHASYGLVTAQSGTGVLTVSGWKTASGTGTAPVLNDLVSATYNGGLTNIAGTTGQYICLSFAGGASGLLPLTGTNTIANGTPVTITTGGSLASAPTTATVSANRCSTATATGTASVTTAIGTAYTIFDTITTSTAAQGATATITFTKTTNLAGSISPGDAVTGMNGWGASLYITALQTYVTAVGTNTLTGINGYSVPTSTTSPQMAWRFPQWTAGDCGRLWATKHQAQNAQGAQPILYGPGASFGYPATVGGQQLISDVGLNGGGNSPPAWMIFDLVAAADDPRAVRDLARQNSYLFDWAIRPAIDGSTGRLRDGPAYSTDEDKPAVEMFLWAMSQSIPSYPSLAATGPWAQNLSIWRMFETLPQLSNGTAYSAGWGDASGYGGYNAQVYPGGLITLGLAFDPATWFAPASNNSAWYRNWNENVNTAGSVWGATETPRMALSVLHNDPRVADANYTVQPLQYAFNVSSSSQVTALTGWPHLYRWDAAISRTCWQCASGTLTLFDAATPSSMGGVYDTWRVGQISIWKGGAILLGADTNPSNSMWVSDSTVVGDTLQLGGPGTGQFQSGYQGQIGETPITAWASANAGTYGSQYGDAQSRYAAACTSELPSYNQGTLRIVLDHALRCWVHLKKSGNDEWIFQFDDVALAAGSPTAALPISWHLQYPQNGQTQNGFGGYTTGSTTYLGSNVIKEVEDGKSGRVYGLMSYVASPGTITLNDDCAGLANGQCAPGSSYAGGSGFTHRFTVAGGAAVGASVSSFVSIAGHKLMGSLTDTSFNTTNLNPDANWTGVQLTGAKSTAVALFAAGGRTYSSMASFTTNFSGPGDWIIVGLAPGTYSVTVGGTPVSGSPFNVAAGDSTIYFSSGAGAVTINQGAPPPATALQGQVAVTGTLIIH